MKIKTQEMEIILATVNKQESVKMIEFLKELTQDERKDFLIFMQGFRFAKSIHCDSICSI